MESALEYIQMLQEACGGRPYSTVLSVPLQRQFTKHTSEHVQGVGSSRACRARQTYGLDVSGVW